MRRIIITCLIIFCSAYSFAQDQLLKVEGSVPNLYLTHKVSPKENYYSIGRLYNVSPKTIPTLNRLDFEKALNPGQIIKIPLTSANFSQDAVAGANEVIVPLYHTVEPKEGLYRVSVKYNKVPLAFLKKWNKLSSDAVSSGTNLVIGFLKVIEDQSPLSKYSSKSLNIPNNDLAVTEVKSNSNETANDPAPVVKEKPKKEKPVKEKEPAIEKPESAEEKQFAETRKPEIKADATPVSKPASIDYNGGVFKKQFDNQSDNKTTSKENGSAGVFKSTSGWQDGKYYCLHNFAKPETIIKVTNEATGKSIYAKVLDMIPDIRQNHGAMILISNAAAEELGAGETKFNVSLNYNK